MMEQKLESLKELIFKSKKNGKLNKEDSEKSRLMLSQLLMDENTLIVGMESFMKLPHIEAAAGFLKAYEESDEVVRNKLLDEFSRKQKASDPTAWQLRCIELVSGMISLDEGMGVKLLEQLAAASTNELQKAPSSRIAREVAGKLLLGRQLFRIPMAEKTNHRSAAQIALLMASAMIQDFVDLETREEVIKWFVVNQIVIVIPDKLLLEIHAATSKWPLELQEQAQSSGLINMITRSMTDGDNEVQTGLNNRQPKNEIAPMPLILTKPANDIAGRQGVGPRIEQNVAGGGHVLPDRREKSTDSYGSVMLVIKDCLGKITENLEHLDSDVLAKVKQINEHDARVRNISLEKESLQRQLVDKEQQNVSIRNDYIALQKENEEILAMAMQAEAKAAEEIDMLKKKVDYLLNQADSDASLAVEEFCNRLAQALRSSHADFSQAKEAQMSEKLGAFLLQTVGRIFLALENKGVKFERE